MSASDDNTLWDIFYRKYGPASDLGWGPRLRLRFGYFTPDDIYEATVSRLVTTATTWLDVGCGRDIFQYNVGTAQILSKRCKLLVGLDPSDNIEHNALVHERFRGSLEEFSTDRQFDLLTLRMVAEHIQHPERAVAALSTLCNPGGRVVIYTVFKWSPITVLSSITPFVFHQKVKAVLWNTAESDTFPTVYRMNTRRALQRLFRDVGFEEESFRYLDDCRCFAGWQFTNHVELLLRKGLNSLGLHYPECCLLAVYRKK